MAWSSRLEVVDENKGEFVRRRIKALDDISALLELPEGDFRISNQSLDWFSESWLLYRGVNIERFMARMRGELPDQQVPPPPPPELPGSGGTGTGTGSKR